LAVGFTVVRQAETQLYFQKLAQQKSSIDDSLETCSC